MSDQATESQSSKPTVSVVSGAGYWRSLEDRAVKATRFVWTVGMLAAVDGTPEYRSVVRMDHPADWPYRPAMEDAATKGAFLGLLREVLDDQSIVAVPIKGNKGSPLTWKLQSAAGTKLPKGSWSSEAEALVCGLESAS